MDAALSVVTSAVRTANVPESAPAGIVRVEVEGAARAELLLDSVTSVERGAAHSRVTVPVTGFPPSTGFDEKLRVRARIGRTVIATVLLTPP
jgi:hypothetical protein